MCFDNPFPPNYGGAIDLFYKLKHLKSLGCHIYLHCFVKTKPNDKQALNDYCKSVNFYEREMSFFNIFSSKPFIVQSRKSDELLSNLLKNDYPILFEGLHTTYWLNHEALKHRNKIVRLHNIEWLYYWNLFQQAYSLKEKIYYFSECKKLQTYEPILQHATHINCLSSSDFDYYKNKFTHHSVNYIPIFHSNDSFKNLTGKGDYVLFHGNLSITDNTLPIIRLLKNELREVDFKIIIAGQQPSAHLKEVVHHHKNAELISNPSSEKMEELIQHAHINIILSQIKTGVKLKLINALYLGRFCFANETAVIGTQLDAAVDLVEDVTIKEKIIDCLNKEFTLDIINERKKLLEPYNIQQNAEKLLQIL